MRRLRHLCVICVYLPEIQILILRHAQAIMHAIAADQCDHANAEFGQGS